MALHLQQITIGIPDKVPLAAVKLFESGSLSSGRAAELANMSRVEFLLNLNRFNVFPLASELDELEAKHA
jgi:predicted HTH domain antitoxin